MKVLVKDGVKYKNNKRMLSLIEKLDLKDTHSLDESCKMVKESATAKFDESIDLAYRLNIKQKHNIRDVVVPPHSVGKQIRVLVFAEGEFATQAKEAGADYVGGAEFVDKILGGWLEFDAVAATPDMMKGLGKVAPILGRRRMMPNPKTGTVTTDLDRVVKEFKAGKLEIRADKNGNVHVTVGKKSMPENVIAENILAIHKVLIKNKPSDLKGDYIASMTLNSTMGPGIKVDHKKITV